MIALVPTERDQNRLAYGGGEPRDELHLTLWFLGDAVSITDDQRAAIVNAVRSIVDTNEMKPIQANAFGVAHWNPTSADPAWVLNVGDAPGGSDDDSLAYVRGAVRIAVDDGAPTFVMPQQHTPWQPHVCIIYSSSPDVGVDLETYLGDITFDRIRVAFGDDVTDVLLSQPATVSAALGGDVVPWHKVSGHDGCPASRPWAVVKDATGEVEGCHASEADANQQLAALYASENKTDAVTVALASEPCVDCDDDDDALHFATKPSNAPWNGAASRFTDEQYQRATAACDSGNEPPKSRCFLPHHEPGGALNRSGLHSAAARFNQLKNHDPAAVSRARSHLAAHYRAIGEDVPDVLKAEGDTVTLAAARYDEPSGSGDSRGDDCPAGQHKMPDGSCMSDADMAAASRWSGVLVVEGTPTGDGREFSPGALSWIEGALLRWQKEGSHGGTHDVTVSVGRIDEVWRDGNAVWGRGVLNLLEPDGWTIYQRMKNGFAGGISIDADDIADADVEFVWNDGDGNDTVVEDDIIKFLFDRPEKMIFHGGRVRAATLVDIPAFVEAHIALTGDSDVPTQSSTGLVAAVETHETEVVDEPWKMTVAKHLNVGPREAYAWHTENEGKATGLLMHHDVVDGEVGPANLDACVKALAQLTTQHGVVPLGDEHAVYEHLAAHLRAANLEPPPPRSDSNSSLVAAAVAELDNWRPPRAWFEDPKLSVHTGITVTDQGRVYGHVAPWGECHIGFVEECVTTPYEDQHPYFMTGELICDDGTHVGVGQITLGTGHAPLNYQASRAAEHYDNTGCAVADVVVGNDAYGIWCAGAVRSYVEAARVHQLRASGRVSGDWRRIGGQLRLVGVLAVNVPGFPIAQVRARVASGIPQSLVAAGTHLVIGRANVEPTVQTDIELDQLAMRRVMDLLARRVHDTPDEEGVK